MAATVAMAARTIMALQAPRAKNGQGEQLQAGPPQQLDGDVKIANGSGLTKCVR